MIPYVPEPFIDRSVQYPGRRYITRPDSTVELCQISRSHEGQNAEGAIYAEGTALNAQSFNDEMTKVKDTFDSIDTDLQAKQPALTAGSGILIQNNVISATGGSGTAAYLAGLADVGLYAPASGEVLLFDGSQGKWINGDIVTGKKSGAVVAFGDGAGDLPIKDLNVEIKATQSGTGDPSPSNVRPISGWANVGVKRAGKNIIDISTLAKGSVTYENGILSGTASAFNSAYASGTNKFCDLPTGKAQYTITLTAQTTNGNTTDTGLIMRFIYTDSTVDSVSFTNNSTAWTTKSITSDATKEIERFVITYSQKPSNVWNIKNLLVEVGSTPTTYEPYATPTTVTIALGQTVYGGELDVTTGVLTVTWDKVVFDGSTNVRAVTYHSSSGLYYVQVLLLDGINSISGNPHVISDKFLGASGIAIGHTYITNSGRLLIAVLEDQTITDVAGATAWFAANPTTFVYELAQPVTVQLTPTEIETLQGNNTIFADSGDILNLEYYRDEAKKIIDLFQFDESLKAWTAENFAPLYTDVTGTLLAGETYLILNSPKIFTTSTIDIYTDTFGVAPYAIEVQNGNVRLTFVARASDLNVKVRVT